VTGKLDTDTCDDVWAYLHRTRTIRQTTAYLKVGGRVVGLDAQVAPNASCTVGGVLLKGNNGRSSLDDDKGS
jgi:hypothetical protein